jgi:hypothetical protein
MFFLVGLETGRLAEGLVTDVTAPRVSSRET